MNEIWLKSHIAISTHALTNRFTAGRVGSSHSRDSSFVYQSGLLHASGEDSCQDTASFQATYR